MALTHNECKAAAPKEKPYKLAAGDGLYLLVNPNGAKYWRYKYRYKSKEKLLALGAFPEVTLAKATAACKAARELLANDTDPMAARKAAKHKIENSFKAVAQDWIKLKRSGWSDVHAHRVESLFDTHIYPAIGDMQISDIKPMDIVQAIRKMEAKGLGESCYKALAHVSRVCTQGVIHGLITVNPAAGLTESLKTKPVVTHHRHIEEAEIGDLIRALGCHAGLPQVRIATLVLMHCFVRSGELRQATWDEIDWDKAVWTIPSQHRKGKKSLKASGIPHLVPLSRQAVALLRELHKYTGDSGLMFEGAKRRVPISENSVNKALKGLGYDTQSAHGFRGLASTVLNENGFKKDHIERQLSHGDDDTVRASYNHAQYWTPRVDMMQWWSDYIDNKAGSNVVPLSVKRA